MAVSFGKFNEDKSVRSETLIHITYLSQCLQFLQLLVVVVWILPVVLQDELEESGHRQRVNEWNYILVCLVHGVRMITGHNTLTYHL